MGENHDVINVNFIFYRTENGKTVATNHSISLHLDMNITYEEIISLPIHIQFLLPLDPPRNDKAIRVDVSKGTQNNLQLNELLRYLNIDSEKEQEWD